MLERLEIKEIEIDSPIDELKIGDDFKWSGVYHQVGFQEGISKIVRFYKEVPFWDGVEKKVKKNIGGGNPVWMELENKKLILLGFLQYKNRFEAADSFVKK